MPLLSRRSSGPESTDADAGRRTAGVRQSKDINRVYHSSYDPCTGLSRINPVCPVAVGQGRRLVQRLWYGRSIRRHGRPDVRRPGSRDFPGQGDDHTRDALHADRHRSEPVARRCATHAKHHSGRSPEKPADIPRPGIARGRIGPARRSRGTRVHALTRRPSSGSLSRRRVDVTPKWWNW